MNESINDKQGTVPYLVFLLEKYNDLLRIKEFENGVNKELERQILLTRNKLITHGADLTELEKLYERNDRK